MPAPKGNKNAVGNPGGGRPPVVYTPKHALQARRACEAGFTDHEIADLLSIGLTLFNRWKLDHVDFKEALRIGKEGPDNRVEQTLYRKAMGYSYETEKVFQFNGEVVRAKVTEFVPPDTTAAIFWLKNRRSKEWRDMRLMEIGSPGDFEAMDDVELERRIQEQAVTLALQKGEHTEH